MDETPLTRRQLIAAATGATAAVAGCLGLQAPRYVEDEDTPTGEGRFVELYDAVIDAVAQIHLPEMGDPLEEGGGSGFFIDGYQLVTNAHVVGHEQSVEVRYHGGTWDEGTVLASDMYSDLAVVEVEDPPNTDPIPPTPETPVVGSEVMAIGAPFGFDGSATTGIVSGVNRSLPSPTDFSIPAALQTDAAVNPGNSGGPLVLVNGDVTGVVFAGSGEGLGFAISGALADRVLPTLQEGEDYEHTYLGVQLLDLTPSIAEANELAAARGVYVHAVLDDAPAEGVLEGSTDDRPGQPPAGGDTIRGIDGTETPDLDALSTYLALETSPDETVTLTIVREGEQEDVELTLGTRPDPPPIAP